LVNFSARNNYRWQSATYASIFSFSPFAISYSPYKALTNAITSSSAFCFSITTNSASFNFTSAYAK
jgi:hypothetical protein